jgi:ribosome biogenesis GTPase A
MRKRYSFSSRRTGNIKNIRKQKKKYPDIAEKIIGNSEIIIEVLDARFVEDTRNLEVEERIKKANKKLIYVINKSDLLKKKDKTKVEKLKPNALVSCKDRTGIKNLRELIKRESKGIKKSDDKFDKVTVGILGYPNTGKSSLINLLIGKSSAGVGSDAGFTKGLQKLKLSEEVLLLDSPGVIPKETSRFILKDWQTGNIKV